MGDGCPCLGGNLSRGEEHGRTDSERLGSSAQMQGAGQFSKSGSGHRQMKLNTDTLCKQLTREQGPDPWQHACHCTQCAFRFLESSLSGAKWRLHNTCPLLFWASAHSHTASAPPFRLSLRQQPSSTVSDGELQLLT